MNEAILNIETDVEQYPEQSNVAVTIDLDNGNSWYVQTDKNGDFNPQANCEIYLNDSNDSDFSDLEDYEIAIKTAEITAKEVLKTL